MRKETDEGGKTGRKRENESEAEQAKNEETLKERGKRNPVK